MLIFSVADWYMLNANILATTLTSLQHLLTAGISLLWWNEAIIQYKLKAIVNSRYRDMPAMVLIALLWVVSELTFHMPMNTLCWCLFVGSILATVHLVWLFCRRFFTLIITHHEEDQE